MRRIVVSNIVSLDGYYEGPRHGVMELPMDCAFDAYNLERIRAADTVLLGAASYRGFSSSWPTVADHPEVPPADPRARAYDETNRAISRRYGEVEVAVVSDSLTVDPAAAWAARTRALRRSEVTAFKASGDGECIVFGSRTMWNGLVRQGLVDELHLMVGAAVLAGGTPLFDRGSLGEPVRLRLRDVRRFEGSDNVVLIHAPGAAAARP